MLCAPTVPLWSATQTYDTGGSAVKTKAAILWERQHAVERRRDRARSAEGRRGAGQVGRQRHVPQRRAPGHRRPRRCHARAAADRRPRGRRRGDGGRTGRVLVQPGDHVVFGFIPACGRCPSCAAGHSNLCDLGRSPPPACRSRRHRRHHARAQDSALGIGALGTFAHHTVVNEASCIKIDKDCPLDRACLLGCGVVTGWGSAVYAARCEPGDTVAVVGVGGIGANAIQGARLAGARVIAAIDPVEFKREKAMEFGATHTHASIDEALGALPRHHVEPWLRQGDHDVRRRQRRRARRRRSGWAASAARSSSPTSTRRRRHRSPSRPRSSPSSRSN